MPTSDRLQSGREALREALINTEEMHRTYCVFD